VWVGSAIPPYGPGLTQEVAFKTTDELDKIRQELGQLFRFYALTILMLVVAKSLCVWLEDDGALRWLTKRLVMVIAGHTLAASIFYSSRLFDAHGFLQTGRNLSFWLLAPTAGGATTQQPPPPPTRE
jgi:hypothetical protein